MVDENQDEPGLLGALLPYLVATAVGTVLLMGLLLKFLPARITTPIYTEPPVIVTFDVVKYMNAQRAVASAFLKPNTDKQELNELFMGLSERTRRTIEEEAGPGAVVLIKQAVVQGQYKDITNTVLERLHLPVKEVPTSDGVEYVLDYAPTMMTSVPTMQDFVRPPRQQKTERAKDLLP